MVDQERETPETYKQDVTAPLDPLDIRLNFNCMLNLFTEFLSLYNELLLVLKDRGDLTEEEIARIYGTTASSEHLTKVFQTVFNRYTEYYVNLKQHVTGEVPQVVRVEGVSDTPAENSATGASSTAATASTTIVQEKVVENS